MSTSIPFAFDFFLFLFDYLGWLFDYLDTPFDYWDSVLENLGKYKIAFRSMDDQTRFWIAQQVANSNAQDAWSILKEGTQIAGKKPDILISDGAPNFDSAYMKEYSTYAETRTQHIQHIHLAGDHNNNKMERMNGEVRDREKVMRGLKKMDTVVLLGYQLYHNYFREHEGLGNRTPAKIAGIKIEGANKWVTVIQNASKEVT